MVVNASGPHSGIVNRMAGVSLPLETSPLRREVHVLANPIYGEPGGAVLPVVADLDGGVYFRPEAGGRDLVVGSTDPECDAKDFVADPDDLDDRVTDLYRERQCLRLMQRFPSVRMGPPRGVAALYDVTVRDWYPSPTTPTCRGTTSVSGRVGPPSRQRPCWAASWPR